MHAEALNQDATTAGEQKKSKSGVQFSVEEITPERARSILSGSVRHGAAEDDRAISTYAAMMTAGGWIMNGQPLIFDTEGTLVDGFQRLKAVVKSGVTIRMLVATNVRSDTLHTIDQHRRRSYIGVLESRGVEEAATVMKMMSKLIRIENGSLGKENMSISYQRYDRVLDANPELITAAEISKRNKKSTLHSTARPVLIFMGIKAGKESEVRDFLRGTLRDTTFDIDSPARMLGLQFSIALDSKQLIDVDNSLALAIMAFNDYCAGVKVNNHYRWKPNMGGVALDERGRPKDRKEFLAKAPPNLGMPLVNGYPGLDEGHIDVATEATEVAGRTVEEIMRGSRDDSGREEVRMLLVTPEMARKWLNRFNRGNRKIQQNHIATIKRDIEKDNWMLNAQPICFWGDPETAVENEDARLLNGQHRLMACIQANMPIEVPIAVNIPQEAFATYDVHAKRAVHRKGPRVDERVVTAAARLQWKTDNGIPFSTRLSPSATEILMTIDAHPELEFCAARARKYEDITKGGVMTWFIYHITSDHREMAQEFLEGFGSGTNIKAGNPVASLRDTLGREKKTLNRVQQLGLLTTAWESFKAWKEAGMPSNFKPRAAKAEGAKNKAEDLEPTLI